VAGQESGHLLDLVVSYGRRTRDAASRDIDLSNFYAGCGSPIPGGALGLASNSMCLASVVKSFGQ
tara:strand:+ start:507 stop:701 length:195 start_codon:yes stop_codon:yes gene_type:complete